eukprot:symbB.v1.2.022057.t1/scaffold1941.1/size95522/3
MEVPSLKQACSTLHSAGLLPPTRPPPRSPRAPEGMLRVTVVTPRKGRYTLEISEEAYQEDVRQHLHEAKTFSVELRPYHDPMLPKSRDDVDMRILYKGARMKSTLKDLGVSNGSTLLALPELREPRIGLHCHAAPRGLLMTSTRAWKPSQARKPREALFITPEVGAYRANLVHPTLNPHPPLPMPS